MWLCKCWLSVRTRRRMRIRLVGKWRTRRVCYQLVAMVIVVRLSVTTTMTITMTIDVECDTGGCETDGRRHRINASDFETKKKNKKQMTRSIKTDDDVMKSDVIFKAVTYFCNLNIPSLSQSTHGLI